jgi:hypothetical protein
MPPSARALDALLPPTPALSAPVEAWLVEGGDDRIALDPETGLNRYGCGLSPDERLADFGSSTASTISASGLTAAEARRAELADFGSHEAAWVAGSGELKARLADLCGLPADGVRRITLSASGTDVCRLAAAHMRSLAAGPLPIILPQPTETGRGVAAALSPTAEVISAPIREADGLARPAEIVDAEIERLCAEAVACAGRALLCLLDVSKTGLVAPSPAAAARLKARFGARLTVLVDACQFRLGAETLAAYLDLDFLVAITGSKFLAGPAFSGALILPEGAPAGPALAERPSLGLLLRWEAAATELAVFRSQSAAAVGELIRRFAAAVEPALDASTAFERLAAPAPCRFAAHPWDAAPSIFSFLPRRAGRPLTAEETQAFFARLDGVRLGQPVPVGHRDGRPVSALRLALSARQITRALTTPRGDERLIGRALAALAETERQLSR